MLLAPRVDALEERLELGLLLVPELAVLARERAAAHVLAGLALLVLEFVGDLLDALGLGVVLLAREHVLPPPPLEELAGPLRRPLGHLGLELALEFQ